MSKLLELFVGILGLVFLYLCSILQPWKLHQLPVLSQSAIEVNFQTVSAFLKSLVCEEIIFTDRVRSTREANIFTGACPRERRGRRLSL